MPSIIPGRKPVMEALKAGTYIERIVLLRGVQGTVITELRSLAGRKNVEIVELPREEFRAIADDATTQGVIAIVAQKNLTSIESMLNIPIERDQKGFLLLLDGIEDPQNLGALIRTAECAGVHGVVLPKHHAASVNSTVVKASAGATEHMAIAEVTNLVATIEQLKEAGYWIVGLDSSGEKLYMEIDYSTPVAVIVGSEGKGMRRLVREHCDHLVKIPVLGKLQSLNASVAGALVMYEVVKKRQSAIIN